MAYRYYYNKGARITDELFKKRIEISNTCKFISTITPGDFGSKSHGRNPMIFGLFARIDMVEQIGSGIGRIKQALERASLPVPKFKFNDFLSIIFKRGSVVWLGVNE